MIATIASGNWKQKCSRRLGSKNDTRFGGSSIQSHSWSGVVAQALTDDAIDRSNWSRSFSAAIDSCRNDCPTIAELEMEMIAAIIWKPDFSGEKESYVCTMLYTGCPWPVFRNRVHFIVISYTLRLSFLYMGLLFAPQLKFEEATQVREPFRQNWLFVAWWLNFTYFKMIYN